MAVSLWMPRDSSYLSGWYINDNVLKRCLISVDVAFSPRPSALSESFLDLPAIVGS